MSLESKAQQTARAALSLMKASGNASGSPLVAEALNFIDGARANSIPSVLTALGGKRQAVMNDKDLSDVGKRGRVKEIASSHLGNVASMAKKLAAMEKQLREQRTAAVPIPKADAADVLMDLALAQHIKSANFKPSELVSMGERARLAVARCPLELTGLTPEVHARVHGSLMDPRKATQFAEEAQSLDAARTVVQAAINEVGPEAGWQASELIEAFGADWEIPGMAQTQVERMAAGGPQNAWDALRNEPVAAE
jgi:hypothetical protein